MKRLLIFSFLFFAAFVPSGALAQSPPPAAAPAASATATPSSTTGGYGSRTTVVYVTEMIPGMDCTSSGGGSPATRKYRCEVGSGFSSVMLILGGLIKYATFLTVLVGVLMIVVSGVQYSLSGVSKDMRGDAKKRIQQVLVGLVLLFMLASILNTVAPWVYK